MNSCPICGQPAGFHDHELNEGSQHSLARDRIPISKVRPPASQMAKWEKVADERKRHYENAQPQPL